jgi:colanic acid biosynthesis glycosyl transferase WcaI
VARILLHTLVFAPDGVSTSYLMTDLALGLKRLGHEVVVLTTTPHYNVTEAALARHPIRRVWPGLLHRSELHGLTVWHVQMPFKGERVGGRILDYLRFHGIALLAGVLVCGPADVVITPSPPLTIGVVGWLLARWRRARCVYNVQEIYPDFAINQGIVTSARAIAAMRWLEGFVYRRSDRIVVISEWFRRTLATRAVPASKLSVIPNFVDTELYRPLPRDNAFSREHGLGGSFVVLYGGNVGLSQDWESVMATAAAVTDLPIVFVVVGDGARSRWLAEEIERRGLPNVRLLGYHPRERMPEINAASDLGTIPMKATTTSDTFPSKVYTILACARPVLVSADADSELAWVITESGCGMVVPPDDPGAYAAAVRAAYEGRAALAEAGSRGRAFVEARYSKEAIARQYDEVVRALASP